MSIRRRYVMTRDEPERKSAMTFAAVYGHTSEPIRPSREEP